MAKQPASGAEAGLHDRLLESVAGEGPRLAELGRGSLDASQIGQFNEQLADKDSAEPGESSASPSPGSVWPLRMSPMQETEEAPRGQPQRVSSAPILGQQPRLTIEEVLHGLEDYLGDYGHDPDSRKAAAWSGVINLVKSTMGTAITSIPFTISLCGYVGGPVLLVALGVLSGYSLFLLSACAHKMGTMHTSFNTLARHTYPWAGMLVDAVICVNCMGAAVGFVIIIGQLLGEQAVALLHVLPGSMASQPQFWQTIFYFGLMSPLAMLRDLRMLRYSSLFGLCCVFFIITTAVMHAVAPEAMGAWEGCGAEGGAAHCRGAVVPLATDPVRLLRAVPLALFAFGNQFNLFSVYNEITSPSVPRMRNHVVAPAACICTAVFVTLGLSAYLTYGDSLGSNCLLSFPSGHLQVSVAQLALALVAVCSFPLQMHPARTAMSTLIEELILRTTGSSSDSWVRGDFPGILRLAVSVVLTAVVFVVGYNVTDLGLVFQVNGAISGTGLALWLPGFGFHKLFEEEARKVEEQAEHARQWASTQQRMEAAVGCDQAWQGLLAEVENRPLLGRGSLATHRRIALGMGWAGLALLVATLYAVLLAPDSDIPTGGR